MKTSIIGVILASVAVLLVWLLGSQNGQTSSRQATQASEEILPNSDLSVEQMKKVDPISPEDGSRTMRKRPELPAAQPFRLDTSNRESESDLAHGNRMEAIDRFERFREAANMTTEQEAVVLRALWEAQVEFQDAWMQSEAAQQELMNAVLDEATRKEQSDAIHASLNAEIRRLDEQLRERLRDVLHETQYARFVKYWPGVFAWGMTEPLRPE